MNRQSIIKAVVIVALAGGLLAAYAFATNGKRGG